MFRRHIFNLRQILQFCNVYPVEIPKKKSLLQFQRFSTNIHDERILDQISGLNQIEFRNINAKEWLDRINIMRSYQFLDEDCMNIILKHPEILQVPLQEFKDTVEQWSCSNLTMNEFQAAILKNPVLLEVDYSVIRKRVPQLKVFCGSSSLLAQLLRNSPNVMLDDWNAVLEKINYMMKVRGFTMRDIVESSALSLSLDFIKFRIDLLEKCGIYKQMTLYVHKINKYDPSQHKNPTLNDILNLDEEYFSNKIAKISVEEYEMCYELYMEEINEDIDSDEESSDSESYRKNKKG